MIGFLSPPAIYQAVVAAGAEKARWVWNPVRQLGTGLLPQALNRAIVLPNSPAGNRGGRLCGLPCSLESISASEVSALKSSVLQRLLPVSNRSHYLLVSIMKPFASIPSCEEPEFTRVKRLVGCKPAPQGQTGVERV